MEHLAEILQEIRLICIKNVKLISASNIFSYQLPQSCNRFWLIRLGWLTLTDKKYIYYLAIHPTHESVHLNFWSNNLAWHAEIFCHLYHFETYGSEILDFNYQIANIWHTSLKNNELTLWTCVTKYLPSMRNLGLVPHSLRILNAILLWSWLCSMAAATIRPPMNSTHKSYNKQDCFHHWQHDHKV